MMRAETTAFFETLEFIKTWTSPKMMMLASPLAPPSCHVVVLTKMEVPRLRNERGSVSPVLCCNGANVARSTADVGEAVLSTSSLAAAFSSVHRDNG
jgi:hypothetical protein